MNKFRTLVHGIVFAVSLPLLSGGWFTEATAAQLTLTWADTSDSEVGFSIERANGGTGVFAEVAEAGDEIRAFTDVGLLDGSAYCYRLRAFNAVTYSDYSESACGTTATSTGFSDNFQREDSTVLAMGWTEPKGNFFILNGSLWNGIKKTRHLAVQSSLTMASGKVTAAFTSLNNNAAPAFGLVFGFVDAGNYYAAYRQVGGSAVLKIVRVSNGVETVLAQRSCPNPARDSKFDLAVSVSSGQVVLTGAHRTLTATGISVAPGKVGVMVAGGGTSHVVDDFQAGL